MAEFRNDDDNDDGDNDDDANYDEDNDDDEDNDEDNDGDNDDDEDNNNDGDCMDLVPACLICRLSAHSLKISRASTKVLREEI